MSETDLTGKEKPPEKPKLTEIPKEEAAYHLEGGYETDYKIFEGLRLANSSRRGITFKIHRVEASARTDSFTEIEILVVTER